MPGWSDFESGLAYMNLDEIESDHMQAPDYSSDHEYDRNGVIWSMENFLSEFRSSMDTALLSMVERANEMTANMADSAVYPKDFLNPGDRVISFNYTSTLERLFDIPGDCQILHIHGLAEKGEQLIYGYGEPSDADKSLRESLQDAPANLSEDERQDYLSDRDYYIDKQRTVILRFYEGLRRPLQCERLDGFFRDCTQIDRVMVLGLSMSNVDMPYMKRIERALGPDEWYVWQHGQKRNPTPSAETLANQSFFEKIRTFDSDNFTASFPDNVIGH